MEQQSGIKSWQWVVTAIIIIVLIIIGILVFSNKSTETPVTPEVTAPATTETPGAVNRIIMTDPFPGNVVYVSSVQLANPGFVVIQKDASGKPGAVLGSQYLAAGTNPAQVKLSASMLDGATYYASLYSDTDGDQKFDITKDQPVTDASGAVIVRPFHASSTANAEIKG